MHAIIISIKIVSQNLIANISNYLWFVLFFLFQDEYPSRWWNSKLYYKSCIIYSFGYKIYSDLEYFCI